MRQLELLLYVNFKFPNFIRRNVVDGNFLVGFYTSPLMEASLIALSTVMKTPGYKYKTDISVTVEKYKR